MKEMSFVSSLYHYIRPSKNEASQPLIGITWKPFLMSESDRTAKLPPPRYAPILSFPTEYPIDTRPNLRKNSGVRIRRRCLSISRLQKTGLSLHPVRPAYGQATSRAHRRRSAGRRSWRPTRR